MSKVQHSNLKSSARAAVKAAGYNAKQVSIRYSCNVSASLSFHVRDLKVSLSQIKAIAASFEQVDRCSIVGDILGGGNVYVSVTDECEYARAAPFVEAASKALAIALANPGKATSVCGVSMLCTSMASVRVNGGVHRYYNEVNAIAYDVACAVETQAEKLSAALAGNA